MNKTKYIYNNYKCDMFKYNRLFNLLKQLLKN